MLLFVGCRDIHEGLAPVGDWFKTVRLEVSELNRYDATKVEYPPAKMVKLTMAQGRCSWGSPAHVHEGHEFILLILGLLLCSYAKRERSSEAPPLEMGCGDITWVLEKRAEGIIMASLAGWNTDALHEAENRSPFANVVFLATTYPTASKQNFGRKRSILVKVPWRAEPYPQRIWPRQGVSHCIC